MVRTTCSLFIFSIFTFTMLCTNVQAQDGPPDYVVEAVDDLKTVLTSDSQETIQTFLTQSMVRIEEIDRSELEKRIKEIRNTVNGRWENVEIRPDPEGIRLIFAQQKPTIHLKVVLDKKGIYDLLLVAPPTPISLTKDNIPETFKALASKGISGVAFIKHDGKVLYQNGFGMANKNLEKANDLNTIFGIGSRPIDFTKAAIFLLEQRGLLRQEDSIDQYFNAVPSEKKAITIRHLMTGQSGLPDFFHTEEDWDPDLAWIDRATAEKRILSQELLFEPGTDRKHSHAAFGLLAALIERVSGQSYYEFLKESFFVPAEMNRTNEYGVADTHSLSDFAVGYGPQSVGLPNIPPNWGRTSWLIKGSGGMYSTLNDLLKFYDYLRSGRVLKPKYAKFFSGPTLNLDGSDRGFELFNAYFSEDNQAYLFLNSQGDRWQVHNLLQSIEEFIMDTEK